MIQIPILLYTEYLLAKQLHQLMELAWPMYVLRWPMRVIALLIGTWREVDIQTMGPWQCVSASRISSTLPTEDHGNARGETWCESALDPIATHPVNNFMYITAPEPFCKLLSTPVATKQLAWWLTFLVDRVITSISPYYYVVKTKISMHWPLHPSAMNIVLLHWSSKDAQELFPYWMPPEIGILLNPWYVSYTKNSSLRVLSL